MARERPSDPPPRSTDEPLIQDLHPIEGMPDSLQYLIERIEVEVITEAIRRTKVGWEEVN